MIIFQTSNCISHNDHEDKSKNQQTINGTITKSVGCFVHEFWDIEYCEGEGGGSQWGIIVFVEP